MDDLKTELMRNAETAPASTARFPILLSHFGRVGTEEAYNTWRAAMVWALDQKTPFVLIDIRQADDLNRDKQGMFSQYRTAWFKENAQALKTYCRRVILVEPDKSKREKTAFQVNRMNTMQSLQSEVVATFEDALQNVQPILDAACS